MDQMGFVEALLLLKGKALDIVNRQQKEQRWYLSDDVIFISGKQFGQYYFGCKSTFGSQVDESLVVYGYGDTWIEALDEFIYALAHSDDDECEVVI